MHFALEDPLRRIAPFFLLLTVACQTTTTMPPDQPSPTQPPAAAAPAMSEPRTVLADTPSRVAKMPRTAIDYDRFLLSDNEKKVVAKLIEASQFIDEIFWLQVHEENPAVRAQLARQAGDSALDRAGYEYFLANKGRWDRIDQDRPFISPFGPEGAKPKGAGFYPPDMTKEEFERYVAAHPEKKDELQGLFTVVRRQGNELVGIPYSRYYREHLEKAAERLREAAAMTSNASLRDYLTKLSAAFFTDNYRESDIAWMDLRGPIEVVIGPYEVYEDEMFNYKASFESFVTVVDGPESQKLAAYSAALPAMERNLPEPDEYKNLNRGTDSPIRVVQEIFTAGDARRGVQTAAFNLPNDEVVREQKGSKKVLLKNVMQAKYDQAGLPIARRVVEPSLVGLISFQPFFDHVLFHELSHGLGPGLITQPNGERVDVRILLKELYSAIEECKADVLGEWNMFYARENGLLTGYGEREQLATYAAMMFRSMRFGVDQAHGRGNAVQWNWMREKGAFVPAAGGRFNVDFAKTKDAIRSLATELLTIEATGDYNRAKALLDRYGVTNAEIDGVNARLEDIPVDITPIFLAAGER
jgi:hypothetical protein